MEGGGRGGGAPGKDPEGSKVMEPLQEGVCETVVPSGFGSGLLPLGISMAGLAARWGGCRPADLRSRLAKYHCCRSNSQPALLLYTKPGVKSLFPFELCASMFRHLLEMT